MINRFELTRNERARVQLRRRELEGRIQTLTMNIKHHAHDPDFGRSLIAWRRELMDSRLELAGSGW
jgi:hypothetical protein